MKEAFIIDPLDRRMTALFGILSSLGKRVEYFSNYQQDGYQKTFVLSPSFDFSDLNMRFFARGDVVYYFTVSADFERYFKANDIYSFCFLKDPLFLEKNSRYSAEGAVKFAIENTDRSLEELDTLILGSGSFAKALIGFFRPLCKSLTLSARNAEKTNEIRSQHDINTICLYNDKFNFSDYDLILNTIPNRLNANRLENKPFKSNAVIMELSSKPYAFDDSDKRFEKYNVKYVKVGSIPSKTCPLSAAECLADILLKKQKG